MCDCTPGHKVNQRHGPASQSSSNITARSGGVLWCAMGRWGWPVDLRPFRSPTFRGVLNSGGVLWCAMGHWGWPVDLRPFRSGLVWLARLAGQGHPNLRKHGKRVVDWWFLGVGNNQTSRVQATRLYTTSYQTVRIQDWKDLQATN